MNQQEIKNIAKYIDHTNLKAQAVKSDIKRLCSEAKEYHFHSVCIHPLYVEFASDLLRNTRVAICSVVGFPTGCHTSPVKAFETETMLDAGAHEVDMVIQVGRLLNGEYQAVLDDITSVTEICHKKNAIIKVIIETAYLSKTEKVKAADLITQAGADFIKTSTGFGSSGAKVSDIVLLKEKLKDTKVKIKAAGGIRTYAAAVNMIRAGADRIGTSSGVAIVQDEKKC